MQNSPYLTTLKNIETNNVKANFSESYSLGSCENINSIHAIVKASLR